LGRRFDWIVEFASLLESADMRLAKLLTELVRPLDLRADAANDRAGYRGDLDQAIMGSFFRA
jgi:hypothetical protein